MKNIYIMDYYSHLKNKDNGLSVYVNQLSKELIKYNNVRLCFVWVKSASHENFEKEIIDNYTHYYIPKYISIPGSRSYDLQVATYLASEMEGKKNIIVHFNWVNHCPFAYLLKQHIDCKTILTKHCIPWRSMINSDNYSSFLRLNKIYMNKRASLSISSPKLLREQLSYHAMDHIICVTESGKKSLLKLLGYPLKKISVINNGLDSNELIKEERDRAILRKEYGIPINEKVILFAGAVNSRKGVLDLAKAFDQLVSEYPNRKLRLVIAGAGDHNKLMNNVKTNWAKITITGSLSKKQLYDFYAMADIGVIPSYVEQCSYATIEMMMMGLPLIVADVDGLKEIVPKDVGLKVKLKLTKKEATIDIKDLQSKLLYFIENKKIAYEYGNRAKVYALKQFSIQKMVYGTIKTYEKVLSQTNIEKKNYLSPKRKPLVSIILPIHNVELYIKDCLDSIFKQTWENFELIIIDDGSTDNSQLVIKRYNDERLKYVKNEVNKGIVFSLNKGISLAKGKYIARIDGDDMMHKIRLEKQVQYLEMHPNIVIVGSWHYVINDSNEIIGLKEYPVHDQEIKLLKFFMNPFSHPSLMMRKDIFKKNVYSDKFSYCEDYELWMKISDQFHVANIPECLTFFRVHGVNSDNEYLKKQKEATLELLSSTLNEYGLDHSMEELIILAAIVSGKSRRYFTSEERQDKLRIWVNKVLHHLYYRYHNSSSIVKEIEDYIIYDLCEVSPKVTKEKVISC